MNAQKGFTLIELVVAIGIMLIIGAVVTPMLLSHLQDAKVANLNETLMNTKTAFNSYFVDQQGIPTDDGDDGFIDDMISANFLSRQPGSADTVKFNVAETNGNYYINGTVNGTVEVLMDNLDEKIDDGDVEAGILRYDETTGELAYLLQSNSSVTDPTDSTVDWTQ